MHTLLAGRDRAKAIDAALTLQGEGLPGEAIELGVTDVASLSAAADAVAQKYGKLEILVNNAGILVDTFGLKVSEQTIDTWRKTFDTNVFGLIATTQAFLPLLHKSDAGRIVNVSSLLGSLAMHSDPVSPVYDFKVPAYNVSKSAVNAWIVQLAYELRDSRIKINSIHPGYVKTEMNGGEGEIGIPTGARTSVRLALSDDAGPSGGYFHQEQSLPR